jgi:hypothetical protein
MSNDEFDNAENKFYEKISQELYPEHKVQAIDEFASERLRSFYISNPKVMQPAVAALQEGKLLREISKHSPAIVFYVSAIELFLKATLLKPVVYGLVHNEALSEIIVKYTFSQTGFDRYEELLSNLFSRFINIDFKSIKRKNAKSTLFTECKELQKIRNSIIHQGAKYSEAYSKKAHYVAIAVYEDIIFPMIKALGLRVGEEGKIIT